jgi:hypothetical protein
METLAGILIRVSPATLDTGFVGSHRPGRSHLNREEVRFPYQRRRHLVRAGVGMVRAC